MFLRRIIRTLGLTILLVMIAIGANILYAQDNSVKQAVQTADSLASGTRKDVLVSFFQLAFDKLTGQSKELNFTSNPYAIMLKGNPKLAVDTSYSKYKYLRRLNFGFGLKLDTSYRFNGFSSSIKYALIDRRDSSTSTKLFTYIQQDSVNREREVLNHKLGAYADNITDIPTKRKFASNMRLLFNSSADFQQLDTAFQRVVTEIVNAQNDLPQIARLVNSGKTFSFHEIQQNTYDSLKNIIQNGLLWTLGVSDTTYKDQFFFSNILFKTELIKGIGRYKAGSNWEFNSQASLNLVDDSLHSGHDLHHCLLTVEPGFNWVVRDKDNNQSWMELKFSGSYYHNFGSMYVSEKRDSVTANLTFRLKIINNIWVPLEIKYDPRTGNVFGLLNVRANFAALGKRK